MNEPTFDRDGYPTDETLDAIEAFPIKVDDPSSFLKFVREAWSDYGSIKEEWRGNGTLQVEFVTGGWSGNESIMYAIKSNVFYPLYWQSSHRGGLHVFIIPASHSNTPDK